jgi:hypothetical protein
LKYILIFSSSKKEILQENGGNRGEEITGFPYPKYDSKGIKSFSDGTSLLALSGMKSLDPYSGRNAKSLRMDILC